MKFEGINIIPEPSDDEMLEKIANKLYGDERQEIEDLWSTMTVEQRKEAFRSCFPENK